MRGSRAAAALLLGALLALVPVRGADAQAGFERIDRYDSQITIRADGSMRVEETIDYDFGSASRHGIFRRIQVRTRYEPDPDYDRILKISDVSVDASEGTPAQVEQTDENGFKILRIGDPDRTISGRHQYRIRFTVRGALNAFSDHDELYWEAVAKQWEVPVGPISVTVAAPRGLNRAACFAGPQGSRLQCTRADVVDGTRAVFDHPAQGAGEGMTIVVAVVKGVLSGTDPILDERFSLSKAFSVTAATAAAALVVGALALGAVIRLLWRTGRDRHPDRDGDARRGLGEGAGGPVVFRPPGDARPAQIGVLVDERADPLDVTATIVDLAVRGYLEIEELPKEGWFGKTDWNLVKIKGADDALLPFETRLLNGLFEGRESVQLSALKNTFAGDLRAVQRHLYDDCVGQGWFARRPDKVRSTYLALGVMGLIAAVGVLAALVALTHAALIGVPLVLAALVLAAGHRWMPARTRAGSAALRETLGFRRFIETAESERMQFAEEENVFAKYLPYAIVFGETEKWARAFAGLGRDEPPPGMGWYHPYGSWSAFNATSFSDSMDNFAVHTSGTIVSTPASSGSSGFGGGGFSGGGGGGGGGGSW